MTERSHNMLVGLTSVAGFVCLAVLLWLFGYVPRWLEKGYEVRVALNHASGLTEGSLVKLSGIRIGKVRSVKLQEAPTRGVLVFAIVRHRIPLQARVTVEAPFIGGSPSLAFTIDHLDDEQLDELLATDGSAVVGGKVPSLATQFADELKAAMDVPIRQFERFSNQWSLVGSNLNQLIEPRQVEQVDQGQLRGNLSTALARADARLSELRHTVDSINRWLDDGQMRDNVRATATNAALATKKIHESAGQFGELLGEARQHMDRLAGRYVAVADTISHLIHVVQQVVDKVDQGDGSVGKLLNDSRMYDNLNDALVRLQAALKQVQLLVEKWKEEGLPVRF